MFWFLHVGIGIKTLCMAGLIKPIELMMTLAWQNQYLYKDNQTQGIIKPKSIYNMSDDTFCHLCNLSVFVFLQRYNLLMFFAVCLFCLPNEKWKIPSDFAKKSISCFEHRPCSFSVIVTLQIWCKLTDSSPSEKVRAAVLRTLPLLITRLNFPKIYLVSAVCWLTVM